jgi:MYXO-CTERM domain-containing protein
MKARVLSLFAVAVLVGGGLVTAGPVLAADPTLGFTLSTTTPTTGDAVTVTPTGSYSPSDSTICRYGLGILPVQIANQNNEISYAEAASTPVSGKCPPWTFILPNLNQMVSTGGLPTTVNVGIFTFDIATGQVINSDETVGNSGEKTITYAPSGNNATASSNLPVMLWSLSNTKSMVGEPVIITPYILGFAESGANSLSNGPFISGATFTCKLIACEFKDSGAPFGSDTVSSSAPLTFTQADWGATVYIRGVIPSAPGHPNFSFSSFIYTAPTPEPTVAPTPTALVVPSASASPTVAPMAVNSPPTNDQSLWVVLGALLLLLLLLLLLRRRRKDEEPADLPFDRLQS